MYMGKLIVFVLFRLYNSLEAPVTIMCAQGAFILHVMQEQQ